MRITGRTVVRNYISNLERNFSNKNDSEKKISSNRQFSRASENPVKAAKALKVRKALSELDSYQDNLETAKSIYESAESSVMKISELMQSTYEKLVYGANGTQGDSEDEIVATAIETYADEMVRLLNITVADRKIFGGTNNDTNAFAIETDGIGHKTCTYNGESVNKYSDPNDFKSSDSSYTDIGIGMHFLDNGEIDDQSALAVTFNGAQVMGCGYTQATSAVDFKKMSAGETYNIKVTFGDEAEIFQFDGSDTYTEAAQNLQDKLDGLFGSGRITVDSELGTVRSVNGETLELYNEEPAITDPTDPNYVDYTKADIEISSTGNANNIIQLTLDAAAILRSGDKQGAAHYADLIFAAQTNLSLSIADIGNKEEFIDFNIDRLTNNQYSLYEQQNNLEGTDLGTEITNWKVLESIYNATLQMSSTVVPQSIFDYIK